MKWRECPGHVGNGSHFMARTKDGYYLIRPSHMRGTFVAWWFTESGNPVRVSAILDSLDECRGWCERDLAAEGPTPAGAPKEK